MALTFMAVQEAAADLLGCVCDALGRAAAAVPGHPGCPCRACVVPGQAALDACDDPCGTEPGPGGQLTVNVARVFPVLREGSGSTSGVRADLTVRDLRQCGVPDTAVELVVTVARCSPGPTETGCPPSCEDLNDAALDLHVDILAVQQAVLCCFAASDTAPPGRGRRFVLGETRVIGPQGGCVAAETRVTVLLPGIVPTGA